MRRRDLLHGVGAAAATAALAGRFRTADADVPPETTKIRVYRKWRNYDPEDAIRFYALRLNEIGMIKSSPQKIIAQGTDWRRSISSKRS